MVMDELRNQSRGGPNDIKVIFGYFRPTLIAFALGLIDRAEVRRRFNLSDTGPQHTKLQWLVDSYLRAKAAGNASCWWISFEAIYSHMEDESQVEITEGQIQAWLTRAEAGW